MYYLYKETMQKGCRFTHLVASFTNKDKAMGVLARFYDVRDAVYFLVQMSRDASDQDVREARGKILATNLQKAHGQLLAK